MSMINLYNQLMELDFRSIIDDNVTEAFKDSREVERQMPEFLSLMRDTGDCSHSVESDLYNGNLISWIESR